MRILRRPGLAAPRAFPTRSVRGFSFGPVANGGLGWGIVVILFMRLLAGVWAAQTLVQWVAVLVPGQAVLDQETVQWGAAVVFFAVLDPVVAVGLWLATPWGGVIWLFAAVSQILVALAMPGFYSLVWIVVDCFFIGLYFVLTWLASRSTRPKRSRT